MSFLPSLKYERKRYIKLAKEILTCAAAKSARILEIHA